MDNDYQDDGAAQNTKKSKVRTSRITRDKAAKRQDAEAKLADAYGQLKYSVFSPILSSTSQSMRNLMQTIKEDTIEGGRTQSSKKRALSKKGSKGSPIPKHAEYGSQKSQSSAALGALGGGLRGSYDHLA